MIKFLLPLKVKRLFLNLQINCRKQLGEWLFWQMQHMRLVLVGMEKCVVR